MKPTTKALTVSTSSLAAIAAAIGATTACSRLFYGRSLRATLSEWFLRLSGAKVKYESAEAADWAMIRDIPGDETLYSIPKSVHMQVPVTSVDFNGMQLIVLNPNTAIDYESPQSVVKRADRFVVDHALGSRQENGAEAESPNSAAGAFEKTNPIGRAVKTLLYFHGGAYVALPLTYHWRFLNKVAKHTGMRIIVPMYPLAPVHTYREAFPPLLNLYDYLRDEAGVSHIILMGDSAGGGLAAAFCELLAKKKMQQPHRLILLSPWVDLTMTNPELPKYDEVDPLLGAVGQKEMALQWAGGDDLNNFLLSPLRGDVSGLRNVDIYTGTRELLYPDCMAFYHKLDDAGVTTSIHVGHGLNHVYPFYPTPEAKRAVEEICKLLTKS